MKCAEISVSDESSKYEPTLFEFVGSQQEQSPLGKLLIALVQETAWSGEYSVNARFAEEGSFLSVNHKTFLRGRPLEIKETKSTLSVSDVEKAVYSHIRESQEWTRPFLSMLQGQVNDLQRTLESIATDKARAAIIAVFPEVMVADLEPVQGGPRDLYAFGKIDDQSVLVARKVGNDFTGGVAQVPVGLITWYGMENGTKVGQRHAYFWTALARAFTARELNISEKDLGREKVYAKEKAFEWPQADPYIVEKVVLRIGYQSQTQDIVVEFGPDNLPTKATIISILSEEVAPAVERPHYSPG